VLLVFATTSKNSFESIQDKWHPEIDHYLPDVPYILVGSKVDIRDAGEQDKNAESTVYVTKEEGTKLAEEIEAVAYMEVSSKTGKGLDEVFKYAMKLVLTDRGVLKGKKDAPAAAASSSADKKNKDTKKKSDSDSASAGDKQDASSSSDDDDGDIVTTKAGERRREEQQQKKKKPKCVML
jgi:Ras-related C3 botulinum toxin substrate 1